MKDTPHNGGATPEEAWTAPTRKEDNTTSTAFTGAEAVLRSPPTGSHVKSPNSGEGAGQEKSNTAPTGVDDKLPVQPPQKQRLHQRAHQLGAT